MDLAPEIDPAALATLQRIGGDKFVAEMIDVFLRYVPQLMAEARSGLASGNLEPLARAGHTLKSSAGHLGARSVQAVALRIEQAAARKDAEAIRLRLAEMEETYAKAKVRLEEARRYLSV